MNKVTKLKHDWILVDYDVYEKRGVREYRLLPPKWAVDFEVSEVHSNERGLEENVRRAGRMLVDEILNNPHVKEEVDRRLYAERSKGYFGAYAEMQQGVRFDLGG